MKPTAKTIIYQWEENIFTFYEKYIYQKIWIFFKCSNICTYWLDEKNKKSQTVKLTLLHCPETASSGGQCWSFCWDGDFGQPREAGGGWQRPTAGLGWDEATNQRSSWGQERWGRVQCQGQRRVYQRENREVVMWSRNRFENLLVNKFFFIYMKYF